MDFNKMVNNIEEIMNKDKEFPEKSEDQIMKVIKDYFDYEKTRKSLLEGISRNGSSVSNKEMSQS
jgi:hypothetical protein